MADELGGKQGLDRRRFFQTAAGMAASFVAMNEVYGPIFGVSKAEAATPAMAQERADGLKDQFIMDMHTHFLRDDTRIMGFVKHAQRRRQGRLEQDAGGQEQTIEDLKFANYLKEVFLDSDTKVALISRRPRTNRADWFLTNEQKAEARKKVNDEAGSRRLFSARHLHAGTTRLDRRARRAISRSSPIPARAIRLATIPTRTLAQPSLAHGRREAGLPSSTRRW